MPDTGLLGRDHVLNAVVDELWDSALAPATRDAYHRGFACFERFAIMYLIPKNYVYNLPVINENTIVYFIAHCFHNLKLKFCTIKLYLAGIRYAYIRAGCANPLISNAGTPLTSVSNILNAVKRIQGQQRKTRLPITFNILCKIVNHLRKGVFSPYIDIMLEAACTLAFFGFLRCGEFTKTTNQFTPIPYLTFGDIKFHDNNNYFSVHLRSSKTDPFRQGITIYIFKSKHPICPVESMIKYLAMHSRVSRSNQQLALFNLPDGKPLTRVYFVECIRNILHRLGYDQSLFSGHSFRSGGATSASAANVEDHVIKMLGRWSSDWYVRYIKTPLKALRDAQQALAQI